MKQLLLLSIIATIVFAGSITKVAEISLSYPTKAETDKLHFYMSFDTALSAGDIIRIGFPDKFKRWGTDGIFAIR